MFTYKVYEDFIPESYQDEIESFLHNEMQWKYVQNISGYDMGDSVIYGPDVVSNQSGFTGYIWAPELKWPTNPKMLSILQPMVKDIRGIFPVDIDLTRIRGGLFTQTNEVGVHNPHVDFLSPHYTFLYYANDSDGNTVIFNEKVDITADEYKSPDSYTIMKSFEPKRGTAILFNGLHYHSSSPPRKHRTRLAININFTIG